MRERNRGGRFLTWEKNVDAMNGKGTCPGLHVKKRERERFGLIHRSCSDIGGKSAGVT